MKRLNKPLLPNPDEYRRNHSTPKRRWKESDSKFIEKRDEKENLPKVEAWEARRPLIKELLEQKDREINRLKIQLTWNKGAMNRGLETIEKLKKEREKILEIPARLEQEYNEALDKLAKGQEFKKPALKAPENIDDEGERELKRQLEKTKQLQFIEDFMKKDISVTISEDEEKNMI